MKKSFIPMATALSKREPRTLHDKHLISSASSTTLCVKAPAAPPSYWGKKRGKKEKKR